MVNRTQAGLAGGLVSSFAMDLVQGGFAEAFERGREPGDLDEEVEAIAGVVRLLHRVVPMIVPREDSETIGHVVHYIFGSGFAVAYAMVRAREPRVSAGYGAAFGLALWLLSDRILIPSTKLGRPWERYSWPERANAVVSHLAYAMTLEVFLMRTLRNA